MARKLIPCRVCGKMFEPCAYCQEHNDTFRWRNFACSIKCAKQYLADTLAYRESLKAESEAATKTTKKSRKKTSTKTEKVTETTETDSKETVEITEANDGKDVITNTEEKTE